MGCVPSSCLPKRGGGGVGDASMQGVVFDELGRWKASIELLVRTFVLILRSHKAGFIQPCEITKSNMMILLAKAAAAFGHSFCLFAAGHCKR